VDVETLVTGLILEKDGVVLATGIQDNMNFTKNK